MSQMYDSMVLWRNSHFSSPHNTHSMRAGAMVQTSFTVGLESCHAPHTAPFATRLSSHTFCVLYVLACKVA